MKERAAGAVKERISNQLIFTRSPLRRPALSLFRY